VDWNDLRYLLAVHRRGSLAGAAAELKVTKATASRRIAALERALGARLVERMPNGLVLTDSGRAAIDTARGIEDAFASMKDHVATASDSQPRGRVRLTAPQWLAERFLIPALPELSERHAQLEVELVGTNQVLNLAQREADLAVRNVRPTHRSLTSRRIARLGGCIYASRLYLQRRGTPSSPDAIRGHDVLVYEGLGGMPGFEWLRDPARGGRVAFRANDPEALVSAATAGLGLAAVPCLLGDPQPELQRVDSLGHSYTDLLLVSQEASRGTPRIRVVSDFVVELMKRHRVAIEG
jgi:DNA-binding transcriptional LysR family regulator